MPKRESTNEELLSEFLIANHNLESIVRKMHDCGRTKELDDLFMMFRQHYDEAKNEILRRMNRNAYKQRKS